MAKGRDPHDMVKHPATTRAVEQSENETEFEPLAGQAKNVLDREGRKQGLTPQNDIFMDQNDDRGQDIADEMAREETVSTIENE
jgi:hypothetical protein